nr:alpha/beta fold hydrolase [Micromonospora sp. DSM 115978]
MGTAWEEPQMVGRFSLTGTAGEIVVHRWSPCATPRYIALLSHGYAEHARRYDHVAEHLTRDGAVVYAPDHIGHGRSGGQRALVEDVEIPVTDLHLVAEDAKLTYQGRPVVLVGHSMGGLIATRFAQRFRDSLAALALSGPVVGVTPGVEALLDLDQIPDLPLDPWVLSRDPTVVQAYAADPLVYR